MIVFYIKIMSNTKWIGAAAGWFLGGGPIGAIIGYYLGSAYKPRNEYRNMVRPLLGSQTKSCILKN